MKSPINVRPSDEKDYAVIYALHGQLFRAHIEKIWGWKEDWQKANFAKSWEESDTRSVEYEGEHIGYIQKIIKSDHLFLQNIGLCPSHQGRGIGALLLRELQIEARSFNFPIRLFVFITNEPARAFYKRMGFVDAERGSEFQEMIWTPEKAEQPAAANHAPRCDLYENNDLRSSAFCLCSSRRRGNLFSEVAGQRRNKRQVDEHGVLS